MKKTIQILSALSIMCLSINRCMAYDDDYVYKSEFRTAYSLYSNALSGEKSAQNYYNMCKISYRFNDFKQGVSYCKIALTEAKEEDDDLKFLIYSMLGDIYLSNSNNKEIILEFYKEALKHKTENTDKFELAKLYLNTAKTYRKHNDAKFAFEVYVPKAEEILKTEKDLKYNLLRAEVNKLYSDNEKEKNNALKAKEYNEIALKELEIAGEYKDTVLKAHLYKDLAQYYLSNKKDKKKYEEYYKLYSEEIEKYPYSVDIRDRAAVAVMRKADLDERFKNFPYDINVNIESGYRYINDDGIADKFFNRATAINPESALTMLAIAGVYCEAYLKTKNIVYSLKMNEYIKRAEDAAKFSPGVYKGAGLMKLSVRAYKSADLYYNKYIEYSADKSTAYCNIASDYWKFGSNTYGIKKVIANLEEALKINPGIDDTYKRMLISAYMLTKNNKKAEETKEKYLN